MRPDIRAKALLLVCCFFAPQAQLHPQAGPDSALLAAIMKIRAVDNHSHAMPARLPASSEYDRPDPLGKTQFENPVRLRVSNPEYAEAWRALYGYPFRDMSTEHAREALRSKLRLMTEKGTSYPSWVLDQAGVDIILVSMPALGAGQKAPRFLWVPQADGMLFPFGGENAMMNWARRTIGIDPLPPTLRGYLDSIRTRLIQWRHAGAPAMKFVTAYVRPLDFSAVAEVLRMLSAQPE